MNMSSFPVFNRLIHTAITKRFINSIFLYWIRSCVKLVINFFALFINHFSYEYLSTVQEKSFSSYQYILTKKSKLFTGNPTNFINHESYTRMLMNWQKTTNQIVGINRPVDNGAFFVYKTKVNKNWAELQTVWTG